VPPAAATQEEDDKLFEDDPWVMPPLNVDYGFNIKLGPGSMINWNSSWVDTCPIRIGARTIVGPNCCFYSGMHPIDPAVRNGLSGPESGKEIDIGDDCWLGGNVIVLAGVSIGRGCTIGAGSVVTKVSPNHIFGLPADPDQEYSALSCCCGQSRKNTEKDRNEYIYLGGQLIIMPGLLHPLNRDLGFP
jgi:carbonic anhydrase/acetyltransferase-like protein (isoleucine patch superfamily)